MPEQALRRRPGSCRHCAALRVRLSFHQAAPTAGEAAWLLPHCPAESPRFITKRKKGRKNLGVRVLSGTGILADASILGTFLASVHAVCVFQREVSLRATGTCFLVPWQSLGASVHGPLCFLCFVPSTLDCCHCNLGTHLTVFVLEVDKVE